MAPGEGLNERELGDQLGSSRTPVREALLLLAVEGLVAVHPHEGYFVAPVTREEGEDLFGLLGHVERRALVAGRASVRGGAQAAGGDRP